MPSPLCTQPNGLRTTLKGPTATVRGPYAERQHRSAAHRHSNFRVQTLARECGETRAYLKQSSAGGRGAYQYFRVRAQACIRRLSSPPLHPVVARLPAALINRCQFRAVSCPHAHEQLAHVAFDGFDADVPFRNLGVRPAAPHLLTTSSCRRARLATRSPSWAAMGAIHRSTAASRASAFKLAH